MLGPQTASRISDAPAARSDAIPITVAKAVGLRSRPMPRPHDPAVRLRGSPGSIRGSAHHGGQCNHAIDLLFGAQSLLWSSRYDANGDLDILQDELASGSQVVISPDIVEYHAWKKFLWEECS